MLNGLLLFTILVSSQYLSYPAFAGDDVLLGGSCLTAVSQDGPADTRVLKTMWARVIPEDVNGPEVVEILASLDNRAHGGTAMLNPVLQKTHAAIIYLAKNQLVFYSSNARASGIKQGIYPQFGTGSVFVENFYMASYDFPEQLFASMEHKSLEYKDGQWLEVSQ